MGGVAAANGLTQLELEQHVNIKYKLLASVRDGRCLSVVSVTVTSASPAPKIRLPSWGSRGKSDCSDEARGDLLMESNNCDHASVPFNAADKKGRLTLSSPNR